MYKHTIELTAADKVCCKRCSGRGIGNWFPQNGMCYECLGNGFTLTADAARREAVANHKAHMVEIQQRAEEMKTAMGNTRSGFVKAKLAADIEGLRELWLQVRGKVQELGG